MELEIWKKISANRETWSSWETLWWSHGSSTTCCIFSMACKERKPSKDELSRARVRNTMVRWSRGRENDVFYSCLPCLVVHFPRKGCLFFLRIFIHRLYPDVCISRELNSFDVPPLIHAVCQCKSKQYFKHTFLEFSKMEIHFENLFFFNKPQI